jgi:hypothetical protein
MPDLRKRVRTATLFFIVGLVLSGLTAIPIPTEVAFGEAVLGQDFSAGGWMPAGAAAWLRTIRDGVMLADTQAPFLLYGTDWLAFGHLAIAVAFVGALRDPVRNRWLFQFGMIICVAVPLWALVFGHVRGIPLWWRLIDASFGIVGFVPVWLCHRWTAELERGSART